MGLPTLEQIAERRKEILGALKAILPTKPISDPEEFNRVMMELEASGLCNIVSPIATTDHIPQMHSISLRTVFLDLAHDCYNPKFCGEDERALGQTAVLKLWRNAGGADVTCRRTDDRLEPLRAEFTATVKLQGPDGREVETTKTREVDLRPGSPETEGMSAAQLRQAQSNVVTMADTKAKLRAARAAMHIRQKYTVDELIRPFVIPTLVPMLDTSDPVLRRLVGAKALGITEQIFGRQDPSRALPEHEEPLNVTPDGEVIDAEPVAGDSTADLDLPPEEEADRCECPCGCTEEVSAELGLWCAAKLGAIRCRACVPSASSWDAKKHSKMKADDSLQIPKRPDLTVGRMREMRKGAA